MKMPLSPALSPLVPRKESERGAFAKVVVSRCTPSVFDFVVMIRDKGKIE